MVWQVFACLLVLCNVAPIKGQDDYVYSQLSVNVTEDYGRQQSVVGINKEYLFILGGSQVVPEPAFDFVISLENYTVTEVNLLHFKLNNKISSQIHRTGACSSQAPRSNTLWIYGGYLEGRVPADNSSALISFDLGNLTISRQAPSGATKPVVGVSCTASPTAFYIFGGIFTDKKIYSNSLHKFTPGSGWETFNATDSGPSPRIGASLVLYKDSDNHEILIMVRH